MLLKLLFLRIPDTTVLDGVENSMDPLVHKDSDFLWNEKEGATNRITIANQGKCSQHSCTIYSSVLYDFFRKEEIGNLKIFFFFYAPQII